MTSKKKLKRRIRQLEKDIACALHDKQVIRKRWLDGEKPTWIDRCMTQSERTPLFDALTTFNKTITIGDFTTEEGIAGEG